MKVLVTHISYHCSVGAVKLLRKIDAWPIKIVGCSSYPLGMSSGSLLVDQFYQSPMLENANEYLTFIFWLIETENIDLIISSDETELLLFGKHQDRLQGKAVIPPAETIRLFQDKRGSAEAMAALGISVPVMIPYSKLLKGLPEQKVILRENVSCCSYGIHITTSTNIPDIQQHFTQTTFAQEYISGQEYTVDVLCDRYGEPQVIVPRERLAIRGGITYKCRIAYEPALIRICQSIYRNYKLPGFSNVQFIIKDGIPYFIELNPRLGGTTIASSLTSINLMELFIAHFFKGKALAGLEHYMELVKWGSIVTRYYEETIFFNGGDKICENTMSSKS